jgi:3-oxoadipate enol-lactonase
MPHVSVDGLDLNFALDGPVEAPVIVFSNSLGASLAMWEPQVAALSDRFRCLRYDTRGHGGSASPDKPATIDDLAGDLRGILDALGIVRAHLVGLSLGGMTAQAFAAASPERVDRLVLMATAAQLSPPSTWDERAATARRDGMGALVEGVLARWFTPAFADDPRLEQVRAQILATDPAGYARACGAIRDMDLRDRLPAIKAPTLIIAGADDPATPPSLAEILHASIAGSELVVIPDAAHLLNIEAADAVNRLLLDHLGGARPSQHPRG